MASRRLRALSLVLLFALLQIAAPMLAYARMAGQGSLTLEICSATGGTLEPVGTDMLAGKLPAEAGDHEHCPLCLAGSAALVGRTPTAPGFTHATPAPASLPGLAARFTAVTPPATGPPSLV